MADSDRKTVLQVGFDTEPAKRDLEATKSYINQFSATIKTNIGDSFRSAGRDAGAATADFLKGLASDIAAITARSVAPGAMSAYGAASRLGGMVGSLPGAEYAAGTPQGQKMIDQIMERMRPIAQQQEAGANYLRSKSGQAAATLALGKELLGTIEGFLGRILGALTGGRNTGTPNAAGR